MLVWISGGTGITPCLAIIRDMALQKDSTEISLIFANQTEKDILCRNELENYAKVNEKFHLHYTLDRPDDDWTYSTGFVDADMISKHLPAASKDTLILMCGPPMMMKFVEKHLDNLDYSSSQYFQF